MRTLWLRASSMDQAAACAASIDPDDTAPDEIETGDDEARRVGSCVHAWFETFAMPRTALDDLSDLAAAWEVDPDEVDLLANMTRALWRRDGLAQWLEGDGAVSEQKLSTWTTWVPRGQTTYGRLGLRGQIDRARPTAPGSIAIADLKTGRLERSHYDQARSYALLACRRMGATQCSVTIIYARLGFTRTYRFTRRHLEMWWQRFGADLANGLWPRPTFTPGDACTHCRRRLSCGARAQYLRGALAAVHGGELAEIEITTESLPALGAAMVENLGRCKSIVKAVREYEDAVKQLIRDHGAIPTGGDDGESLVLQPVPRRKLHVTPETWVILQEYLHEDAIASAVSLSISAVERGAGDAKPEGMTKKARIQELRERLEAAQVVTTSFHDRITTTQESNG